MCEARMSS